MTYFISVQTSLDIMQSYLWCVSSRQWAVWRKYYIYIKLNMLKSRSEWFHSTIFLQKQLSKTFFNNIITILNWCYYSMNEHDVWSHMTNRGSFSWPDSYTPYASFSSTILQRKVIHFKMKWDKSINLLIDKNMRKYFLWSIW